ncbi:glycerol-1-phosphate dehydrogenase [NAD(P)+] [Gracilibacillus ureilyticus]|uniref:Glycerol-1-phosphate dehydrogenase [NAD(P)+] n=1 Tax=Gracilibacillus ureilyticus TaxID=531814 RepID=A0A1H9V4L8_9BACI|nr:iron-containing alcohol dehydrogenase family protein [Gracilibacillus ureilyticus]SES16770.1 glycerol-1-phosphate dehydrogenase [NAD(P)+] [Gracilibacillus ureilyticus]
MSQPPITNIPIPAILEISNGAIFQLENILIKHNFHRAVILFDDFTFEHFEQSIKASMSRIKLETIKMPADLDIQELVAKAFDMEPYDVIIAAGGGALIDYGKYIAYLRSVPFISFPTSASNDGFASSSCSIIVNNKKTTVPAKIPYGIIVDLDIIQQAPAKFILAGTGDLMSNITALYDWIFEEKNNKSTVNHFAAMLSKKAVNSFVRTPMEDIKDPIFLKELVSSLTMGGIATVISGNSSPISGSEHLISHALDKILERPAMHGIQVGMASYIMANIQQHRAERMNKVFTRTGLFDYVRKAGLRKKDFQQAVELAPDIKPNRYTYLHEEKYRQQTLNFIDRDSLLQEILD